MSKEEPRFQCSGAGKPCLNPTDDILFKQPLCDGCKEKVREFRRKRRAELREHRG